MLVGRYRGASDKCSATKGTGSRQCVGSSYSVCNTPRKPPSRCGERQRKGPDVRAGARGSLEEASPLVGGDKFMAAPVDQRRGGVSGTGTGMRHYV